MTIVVNQFGKYIDGDIRDEIITAADYGAAQVKVNGDTVRIIQERKDADGNRVVCIKI